MANGSIQLQALMNKTVNLHVSKGRKFLNEYYFLQKDSVS